MKLKVCGMREEDNIREVASLGVDFLGFIFYKESKRCVGEDFRMPELPPGIQKVGVFVNESTERVLELVRKHDLQLVQLHGSESSEMCKEIRKSVKVIKAFGLDHQFDFSVLQNYEQACDYFLFDTKSEQYGGTGRSFDRSILKIYELAIPFFISGGIGPGEGAALSSLHPLCMALDVNSKFEIRPGIKNLDQLKSFIHELPGR